jgi:thiol-disulfide isomerase/thioredoxin
MSPSAFAHDCYCRGENFEHAPLGGFLVSYVPSFLVLLATSSVLTSPDAQPPADGQDGLNAAENHVRATIREFEESQAAYRAAVKSRAGRKDADARNEFVKEFESLAAKRTRCAQRLVAIAGEYPKSEAAFQALSFVAGPVLKTTSTPEWMSSIRALGLDHAANPQLADVCANLGKDWYFIEKEDFLRTIIDKNANPEVLAAAHMSLAYSLEVKEMCAAIDQPQLASLKAWLKDVSPRTLDLLLRGVDVEQTHKECESHYECVIDRYANVKDKRGKPYAERAASELFELRKLNVGQNAPEIEGEDIDGKPLKLSDHRGKVVVLNFWGTWCGPCMAMVPQERSLVKRLEGKPFALFGINSDSDRAKLKDAITQRSITWRSWWDGGKVGGPIATRWNVHAWPTTYVLDAKGMIRFKNVRGEALDKAVDALLKDMESKGQAQSRSQRASK